MMQALTSWIFEVVQPLLIEMLEPAIVHEAIHEQHAALLAAIEKGDAARAERAMKDHLLYVLDVLRVVQAGGSSERRDRGDRPRRGGIRDRRRPRGRGRRRARVRPGGTRARADGRARSRATRPTPSAAPTSC